MSVPISMPRSVAIAPCSQPIRSALILTLSLALTSGAIAQEATKAGRSDAAAPGTSGTTSTSASVPGAAGTAGAADAASAAGAPAGQARGLWDLGAPVETVRANAAAADPPQLLILSAKLRDQDKPDEAFFWFVEGVLRANVLQTVAPDPDRVSEMGSLLAGLAPVFQDYMRCNPQQAGATMDRAIDWDRKNPLDLSKYESQAAVPKADWPSVREQSLNDQSELRNNLSKLQPGPECAAKH